MRISHPKTAIALLSA